MNWILEPWPWYVCGPLIGMTVPLVLLIVGESFGVSSSLRHLNCMCLPGTKVKYLRENDWRRQSWNLFFVLGIVVGSAVGMHILSRAPTSLLPSHYHHVGGMLALLVGGLFVGFGTRYAGGCTSGHSIMGMSNLNWPSLVATISFFVGGLVVMVVYQILPL